MSSRFAARLLSSLSASSCDLARRRLSSGALAVLAFGGTPWRALAQVAAAAWPDRPIRFIVPSPPGGGTDTLTRLVANALTQARQWQFVVDNRAGAGGNIGMDVAAKSVPDGYTIVMGESANTAINPSLYSKMPFDAAKDVVPVALVGTVPLVLVVAPGRSLDSPAAIVAAAKSRSLTFASSGNGTVGHLVGEIWKRDASIELLHVPYKGGGPVMTDLIGGQVDLHFASIPAAAALVKAGKIKPLAVTTMQRSSVLPDVPTLAEVGFPGFDYRVLYGVLAPTGTPADVVTRLNAEINRVLQAPDVRASLAQNGVEPGSGTATEFGAFLDRERTKWARVVKASGARVD
jgi:tripartite-type tricarboxylate transporter receptor subunit TctC